MDVIEPPASNLLSKPEVLFVSNQDGDREIFVSSLDGLHIRQLTTNKSDDYEASWSPDGKKIVFTSNSIKGNTEVFVMGADGSNKTNISNSAGFDGRASWSPDGSKIAFNSSQSGVEQIFLWDVNTKKTTQLTHNEFAAVFPVWSPDGNWIAYQNQGRGNKPDLWITSADGAETLALTDNQKFEDSGFNWSSDSSKIAYHSRRNHQYNLYIYDLQQKKETQLTTLSTSDVEPKWSADGTQILFLSTRGQYGRTQLCLMKEDGSKQRCITDSRYQVADPYWLTDHSILHSNWHGKRFSNVFILELGSEKLQALSPAQGYQSQPMPKPVVLPNKMSPGAAVQASVSDYWRNL